ncbi:MAG: hypothetical protein ACE5EH_07380 [Gammaproteobacteria bacterium]
MAVRIRNTFERLTICCSLLMATGAVYANEDSLVSIELKHRLASEIIPVISPLLDKESAISGDRFGLYIRTTPDTLNEVNKLIRNLDHEPRKLKISIVSAPAGSPGGSQNNSNATIRKTQPKNNPDVIAEFTTLEGKQTRIETVSQSQEPVDPTISIGVNATATASEPVILINNVSSIRDTVNNISVTPHISGDHVIIQAEMSYPVSDKHTSGTPHVRSLKTAVSGGLNEWIELIDSGLVNATPKNSLHTSTRGKRPENRLYIRVSE